MNFKKTLMIAILFAIVAGVYWWDHKRVKGNEERKESESRLVAAKRDALSEISIQRGAQTVKLVKQGEAWSLTEPVKALADDTAVSSLLDEIDRAKKTDPFDPQGKLADYGLQAPGVKAEIKAAADNYVQTVELGGATSAGDEVYARVGKDKNVFTLPQSLKTQLTKPAADLRDKRTLPVNLNQATSLTLAFGGKTLAVAKRGTAWALTQPAAGDADEVKIGELLRQWNEVKASDFVDTQPLALEKMGFTSPTLTATVFVPATAKAADAASSAPAAGTALTMVVGAAVPGNAAQRYAMRQGGTYAYTIAQTAVAALQPTLDDLRSKQLFTLKPTDVGHATFLVRGNAIDLVRDSTGQWHFKDDPATKLDNTLVEQKIADLTALKATRFIDEATSPVAPSVSGLDQPNLRLTLASRDGKTTETIETGRKAGDEDYVFARLPLRGGQLIGVDWQQPGKFFVTRDELLDKNLYDFDEGRVQTVTIQDGAKKLTLKREKAGGWTAQAEGEAKTFQVEGPKMSSLNYSIGSLKWSRRLDPQFPNDLTLIKSQNLENPGRTITLLDAEGKELARLGQGSATGNGGDHYVYIRRGEGEYFAIDKTAFAPVKSALDKILGILGGGAVSADSDKESPASPPDAAAPEAAEAGGEVEPVMPPAGGAEQ